MTAPNTSPNGSPPPGVAEMPFLDHLEELRWRLIYALGALAVGMVVAFALVSKVDIIGFLSTPVQPYLKGQKLFFTHASDAFTVVLNTSLVLGLVLASPVIAYQVWAFLSPALYTHEKRVIVPVLLGGVLLFVAGVALAFYVILPLTLGFLLTFQTASLTPMLTAREYFGFATSMSLALGAVFEVPILILGLTALGLVTPPLLVRFRRHAVVACIIGAAFITPGADPLSMAVLAGPLYLLYELSVVLSTVIYRRRLARERAREAAEAAELARQEADAARLAAEVSATEAALALEDHGPADHLPGGDAERGPRRLDVPAAATVPFDQQGLE